MALRLVESGYSLLGIINEEPKKSDLTFNDDFGDSGETLLKAAFCYQNEYHTISVEIRDDLSHQSSSPLHNVHGRKKRYCSMLGSSGLT